MVFPLLAPDPDCPWPRMTRMDANKSKGDIGQIPLAFLRISDAFVFELRVVPKMTNNRVRTRLRAGSSIIVHDARRPMWRRL
jgi:hypothetical protein